MNKITGYFRDSYKELTEKVSWPSWSELQQATMIVLGATVITTLLVMIMDITTQNVLSLVYKQLFK